MDRARAIEGRAWKAPETVPTDVLLEASFVFDKGLLDFFVKQNLTRCRRGPVEEAGKKIPLGARVPSPCAADSCGRLAPLVISPLNQSCAGPRHQFYREVPPGPAGQRVATGTPGIPAAASRSSGSEQATNRVRLVILTGTRFLLSIVHVG